MNLFKVIIPEITFSTGAVIVFFSIWNIASLAYAMFFLGAFILVAAGLVSNVMSIVVEENEM